MKGVSFLQVNQLLAIPPDVEGYDLPVCQTETREGHPLIISCWEPTDAELEVLMRTKRLWLWTMSRTMPPTSIEVQNPWEDNDQSTSESPARDDRVGDGEGGVPAG